MAPVYYFSQKRRGMTENSGTCCADFISGDKIFIYASNGRILCDTTVISDTRIIDESFVMYEEDFEYRGEIKRARWVSKLKEVKVKADDVDLSAIEGYNTEISHYTMDNKVIVDNISRNSAFFTLDNCMVRHNLGRVLIKTREGIIKNCTFKNTSYAGVVMSAEPSWGESSVPCNVTVTRCLFNGTSRHFDREKFTKFAAIAVEGLGDESARITVSENSLPARNITVTDNVFKNVRNDYYVAISGVKGVKIQNNVFEKRERTCAEEIGRAICINGCIDVNISNNTYSAAANGDVTKVITAKNYKNLHGSDVEGVFPIDNLNSDSN